MEMSFGGRGVQRPKVLDPALDDRSARLQQMRDLGFDEPEAVGGAGHAELEEKCKELTEELQGLKQAMEAAKQSEAKTSQKLQSFQQVNRSQSALVRAELQKCRRKLAHTQAVAGRMKEQIEWLQAQQPALALPPQLHGLPSEEEAAEEAAELLQMHRRWENDIAQLHSELRSEVQSAAPQAPAAPAGALEEAGQRIAQLEVALKRCKQEGEQQARDSAASRPAAAAAGPTDTPRPEQTDYADDLMAVPHVNPKCTTCSHDEVERLVKRVSDRIATGSTQLGVVVLPGSFNPPHRDHLRCLELAREVLEARGVAVLAGFLQPSSDRYLVHKVGAERAMCLRQRVLACHIAVREASGWIGVWCSGAANGEMAADSCGKFCSAQARQVLEAAGLRSIGAHVVCGADFVVRYGWRAIAQPRVVITRPGTDLPPGEPPEGWLVARADSAGDASSTAVRELICRGEWEELVRAGWVDQQLAAFLRASFEQGELFMEQR
mmetsp:Transcript_64511/g.200012  ORF Transcript_64511/g.200012 Transcript_64511/m.200012 type:complete len:493 (-) Transcript_64511:96-1574(-)